MEMESEKIILKVFWEQPDGEHFGGGMVWDKEGNLLLSIGCDSAPTQYAPYAFNNPGGRGEDGGRTAGNTNDLRGTIIRIKPTSEGDYTIPTGNLFDPGTAKTRPEIYVMGNRNPWRLTIDDQTGYLHWGEVGPDAGVDNPELGPMGYDEFNVAKSAGNFGWPYLIGYNLPYSSYDYVQKKYGAKQDSDAPQNTSPNNTGLTLLPPGKPALIAYPYQVSDEWPVLSSAARSAVGGPIFRKTNFAGSLRPWPDYYEGKWLITDYVRNWIMVVDMDTEREKVISIDQLLPSEMFNHKQPLDMDFGPSGDLYLVEYGVAGQGKISKYVYNSGNRRPVANATVDRDSGQLPLALSVSGSNSYDPDGDALTFLWTVQNTLGSSSEIYSEINPKFTLHEPGKYQILLQVSDAAGETSSDTLYVVAGNTRPKVKISIVSGNKSFFFSDQGIQYKVDLFDEDKTYDSGSLSVTAEYIPSGLTSKEVKSLLSQPQASVDFPVRFLKARQLLQQYNCMSCHKEETELVGPSYTDVALRYHKNPSVYDVLEKSIKEGSTGKWGDNHMPPHTMVTKAESLQLIEYILSLNSKKTGLEKLRGAGTFFLKPFPFRGEVSRLSGFYRFSYEPGAYLLRAQYTDRGGNQVSGLELSGEDHVLLRYPLLTPESADYFSESGISYTPSTNDPGFILTGKGGFIGYRQLDLSHVSKIEVGVLTRFWHWSHFVGGTVEMRIGSPDGELIGSVDVIAPETLPGEGPFFGEAAGKPVSFDVSGFQGEYDLYLIIKNPSAKETNALMILTGLEFLR
jgi:cytochrome c